MTPDYTQPIDEFDTLRDLGVIMSSQGGFQAHISHLISKVKQKMGWIHRTFITNNVEFRRFMWINYIRSNIDYASQLWCPSDQIQMSSLESLQRMYTACTNGLQHMDYWTRLRWFRLSSIERRLQRYRIIYVWKIANDIVINPGIEFTNNVHSGKLVKIHYKKCHDTWSQKLWDQSLQIHGGKSFNSLPVYLRNCPGYSDSMNPETTSIKIRNNYFN